MWTWDSTQIDFSQTCWTFDGYNGCANSGGGYDKSERTAEIITMFQRVYNKYEQMRIERIVSILSDLNDKLKAFKG